MEQITFSTDLERNIRLMQTIFQGDNTFVTRRAVGHKGLSCAVFFFDGMVNNIAINQSVVRPIVCADCAHATADELARTILQINDSRVETDVNKLFASFLYGDTVVFTEGDARPVVVNTKGFSVRTASEPENERVLSGPREGFTECFMPNLALIRRRLNDKRLKFTFLRIGSRTNTVVCLCYLAGVCEAKLVRYLRRKLEALEVDSVLDANYLAERIRDHRFSPFPTLGTTERPDVVAARLVEGRCAVVVDGSPVVLTAPFLFQECFQSNDDYYIGFLHANLSRLLRVLGFVCTLTFPAVYTALLLYHRELVPARLLFAISAAQRGVALPLVLLVLAGCTREVSPVSALALDKAADGYRLTAEIVRQDSLDDAASPAYLTVSGSDMPDLLTRLGNLLPGELYLSHAQVLLLGESAAEESILPLADYLCTENDVRLSLRVAVVRGSAASDLLRGDDEVYALSELLERAAREGTLPDTPLYRAAEVLHASGTAILPALYLDEYGQTAPAGTAVFAGSRLSCFLDGNEIGGGDAGA